MVVVGGVSGGSRGFSFPTLFTLVLELLGRLNGIHHLSGGRPEDEAFHSDFVITAQNETDDLAAAIFTTPPPKGLSPWGYTGRFLVLVLLRKVADDVAPCYRMLALLGLMSVCPLLSFSATFWGSCCIFLPFASLRRCFCFHCFCCLESDHTVLA